MLERPSRCRLSLGTVASSPLSPFAMLIFKIFNGLRRQDYLFMDHPNVSPLTKRKMGGGGSEKKSKWSKHDTVLVFKDRNMCTKL